MLEERFEITISAIELGDTGHHADALLPYIDAGDDVIDVCAIGYYQSGKPLIVYDLILPWNGVKYIDYSKPWWNSSLNDTLSILGQSYYLSGAINWTHIPGQLGSIRSSTRMLPESTAPSSEIFTNP